jgi:hypothetical protein
MRYIRAHWWGEQSLAWSFFVNLALLRAVIHWLEGFTRPPWIEQPLLLAVASVAYILVFHMIVYAWQVVGVVRASERLLRREGSSIWPTAANIGIVASLAMAAISIVGAAQMLLVEEREVTIAAVWGPARAERYEIAISPDGRTVYLRGDFELGLTQNLEALLRERGDVETLVLRSDGGYVAEGRGIARLAREYGLHTHVEGTCKSACATAFVGGVRRTLGPVGRLGFHQYWVKPVYAAALVDPSAEQEKDRQLFRQQGVAEAFLERIFDAPHSDVWFPTHAELLAAGVAVRN